MISEYRIFSLVLIIKLAIGCGNPDKSCHTGNNSQAISATSSKSALTISDTLKNELPGASITITVSYAALECGCPQWFETKLKDVKFLEGVERFYLEPISKDLINANDLWDGVHLPLTLKITGRFSNKKEMPLTYRTKGAPEKARIFWYDKIAM